MKIGLCMIVKNEAHIIHESLTCTLPLISTFCIVDTGSTDDTIQKIKKFYSEKGIEGEVHERPWKNFGHNRSEALQLCDGKMDYALVIDADDLMGFPENTSKLLTDVLTAQRPNSCQLLIKQDGLEYWRAQIFKCNDGWKYVGVLHEYPTNGKENCISSKLPKDIYMVSRRLGGRTIAGDKPKRDIEVLEQGLKDEPDNDRYMFYLAQSYRDGGETQKSMKMYKRRFKIGRWAEEAWFAAYQVGLCYKALKNIPKFEYWMQRAYEYRPWRAEPIYHLTEYFRVTGKLHKAYEYSKLGMNIAFPSQDVLFVEKFPHEGGFLYERTILDYYVHTDKKIGLRDTVQYLLKNGMHVQNVISNLKFYASAIQNHTKQSLNLPLAFGEDFRPSAVCVLNYPFANVRYVNYLPPENNIYKTKDGSNIQTQNAYINLDTNEVVTKMDDSSISLSRFPTSVKGLEDIRLFTKDNETQFIATNIREYDPAIRMITGKYNTENGIYSDVSVLKSPVNAECEKNWLPVPNTDHIIYNWSPLRIIRFDGSEVAKHDVPPIFSLFRGSTIPVEWNGNWLVMIHIVEYSTPRHYYHLLVELEKYTYTPLKITLPFKFHESSSIEYCLSMRMIDQTIIECYPSSMDSNLSKYTFNIASLEWVSTGLKLNHIVRVPEQISVYWSGKYSDFRPNGYIETFVKNLNIHRATSFLFFQNDGIMSDRNFNEIISSTTESRIVIVPDSSCKIIESYAKPNTFRIVCGLCTRGTTKQNVLLLPLDDEIFEYGLSCIFKDINMIAWENRKSKLFWRGNASGFDRPSIREKLVKQLFDNAYSDIRFSFFRDNGVYANTKIDKKYIVETRSELQDHLEYKYLLIIDGNCIASNHQWVFGSGSVPVMVTHPENNWWFKHFLKPMENYVPINYDLSDLEEKLEWLVKNDDKAKQITENAMKLSQEIFTSEYQKKYIKSEIQRISSSGEAI